MTGLTRYRLRSCWCFKSRMAGILFVISESPGFWPIIAVDDTALQQHTRRDCRDRWSGNKDSFTLIRFVAAASGFFRGNEMWIIVKYSLTFLHEINWHVWLDLNVQEEGGTLSLLWVVEIPGYQVMNGDWLTLTVLTGRNRPDLQHPSLTVSTYVD